MFQAVRHWWGSGRGRITARLFAFEFIVVVTGVLVAQALANWAQDRAAFKAMQEAKARAEVEISDNMYAASVYQAAIPCFEDRMREVMGYLVNDCCGGRPELCAPLIEDITPCCVPEEVRQ